jgi:cysteinyl-tRNA synthetase
MKSGVSVDVDEYTKDDVRDFVLWKATKPVSRPGMSVQGLDAPDGTSSARRWRCACSAHRRLTFTRAAST